MPNLVPPVLPPGTLGATPQPTLPLDGLLLRPWRAADAPALAEAFRDPAIQRWHLRTADSPAEAAGWIERWRGSWQEESGAHWAVSDAGGGRLLGRVSLQGLVPMGGQAEISYWTVPEARGRGVCSRAVAGISEWALSRAGFHRVELGHSVANAGSCRVAEKCGFGLEGTRRAALLHADGWHDMHLHARIRGDCGP
ncbi:GNAT family N-acetyltransferase [Phaeacidiphilus oryzae]|uniref:GNAT family N-acetyltransferase n=1 Tax=Phaeacidiphilus oryzae TaxID=348818 RepID=UPI000568F7F6|nr:GNAT family N-acetyltransferase [Phaeacidiphilus oryzae]